MPHAKFNPARGGHAPGHLRERFCELIEDGTSDVDVKGEYPTLAEMVGRLWNCTDTMPSNLCGELDVPIGSSYAQGSRSIHRAD